MRLFIEYDGCYYHSGTKQTQVDRCKTQVAEAAGWRVLRIRQGLEELGQWDVEVPRNFEPAAYADLVLEAIERFRNGIEK